MDDSTFRSIENVGVVVRKEQEFSVRLSREKMTGTGTILAGLIGFGIESAARTSTDSEHEKRLMSALGHFDPVMEMTKRLRFNLESCKRFRQISLIDGNNASDSEAKSCDVILEVTIREWGLRLCLGASEGGLERLQAALVLHARLFPPKQDKALWERDEVYLEGTCRPVQAYESEATLLSDVLQRSINTVAGRITNEILFP
jgi:hypothetical protein